MKTVTQVRESFWDIHPEFSKHYRKTWKQNQYNATIRATWCDYVEMLERNGLISTKLANRATL